MFETFELSRFLGRKRHLFVFALGGLTWRFTSADRPVVLHAGTDDEVTFLPAAIKRSAIKESAERAKNKITITMPYRLDPNAADKPVTQSLGDLWRPYPPSGVVAVTCLALHANDPDQQTAVEWSGRVVQPKFSDTELELTCEPTSASATFRGLGLVWSRNCPLVLYSQGVGMCNVDPSAHALPATLESVVGLTLKSAAFAASAKNLAGGYIEWVRSNGLVESRSVMAHTADAIVIDYGGAELVAGLVLTALPGCAHNWAACEAFENTDNYGGCMDLPISNPFSGNPVW